MDFDAIRRRRRMYFYKMLNRGGFIPPSENADPYWSSVALLLGFESGVDDESSHARTGTIVQSAGDPARNSTVSKFGTWSLRHDGGSSGRFTFADDTEWPTGTSNFTIEGWFRRLAAASIASECLIGQWDSAANQRSWGIFTSGTGSNIDLLLSSTGSATVTKISVASTLSIGVWHHIAADWDGTTYRLYKDGSMIGSATTGVSLHNSTAAVSVLHQLNSGAGVNAFDGYCDEIRVTAGVARYASNSGYTVPTAAFPRS